VRRGVFASVPDLIAAIEALLEAHNDDPQPFVWTASVETRSFAVAADSRSTCSLIDLNPRNRSTCNVGFLDRSGNRRGR
jgi:hypothetical protein